ncbi:MAG: hypothetical protein HYR91_04170 [Flavobacteriia bacterium]|nr:hypothetical protein [Flavobacteriia bacterium]
MKKTLIHSIQIKSGIEKVMFQIKLPRNTKRVKSIKITTNGYSLEQEELLKRNNTIEDEYYKKISQNNLEDNNYKLLITQIDKKLEEAYVINNKELIAKLQQEKKVLLEKYKEYLASIERNNSKSNVTVRLIMLEIAEQEMGSLWLRIPERRDVLFSEVVKMPTHQYGLAGFNRAMNVLPDFGKGKEWINGSKESFFSIDIDPTSTIIEGFYSNLLKDLTNGYQINIYLNLEL